MDLLLENNLFNSVSNKLGELQEKFLESKWGQAIDKGIDFGLKVILPNSIEDDVIDIKNAFIKEGLVDGIQKAVEVGVKKGKELVGIFSGNLEDMTQAEVIKKNSDIISGVSKVLVDIVDKSMKDGLIKETVGGLIKKSKEIILDYADKNIDKVNKNQVEKIQEMEDLIEEWNKAYKNQDFKKMQNAYIKIEHRLEKVMPIEDIINKARKVENLHNLIKNNGNSFDLTEEQIKLAEELV